MQNIRNLTSMNKHKRIDMRTERNTTNRKTWITMDNIRIHILKYICKEQQKTQEGQKTVVFVLAAACKPVAMESGKKHLLKLPSARYHTQANNCRSFTIHVCSLP